MKQHKHAELIKQWADGARIEYYNDCYEEWKPVTGAPGWGTDIQYRVKPETLKLVQNDWHFDASNYIYGHSSELNAKYGADRATEELCKIANNNSIIHNQLEAWVHQVQGNGDGNCYIYKGDTRWAYILDNGYLIAGAVYMKMGTAEWLCEQLNDGIIKLGA